MNKFIILPLILVGCTAPVTHPPAEAFELEVEESQWQYVYDAIEYIKKDYSVALMIDQRVSEGEKINFLTKCLQKLLHLKLDLLQSRIY